MVRLPVSLATIVFAINIVPTLVLAAGGDVDTTFGNGGRMDLSCSQVQVDSYNRIVVASGDSVVRLLPNGQPDPSFGLDGVTQTATYDRLVVQSDDKIVTVVADTSQRSFVLSRYDTAGALDGTFGQGGIASVALPIPPSTYIYSLSVSAIANQSDGVLVLGSAYESCNGCTDWSTGLIARYNPDGSLDQSFGDSGLAAWSFGRFNSPQFLLVAPEYIVAGGIYDWLSCGGYCGHLEIALGRYLPGGAADTSFNQNGQVTYWEGTYPYGQDYVAYTGYLTSTRNIVVPYNNGRLIVASDGSITGTVGGGVREIRAVAPTAIDSFWALSGSSVLRYRDDASLDTAFGCDGVAYGVLGGAQVDAIALQMDGNAIVCGQSGIARVLDGGPPALDTDNDCVPDVQDNCPTAWNPTQQDSDGDRVGDACDACPAASPEQDADGDCIKDDGSANGISGDRPCASGQTSNCDDNCVGDANGDQRDADHDGMGDVCDLCPLVANPGANDLDTDGTPDACDNCRNLANADQTDVDSDGVGDACSLEICGDGLDNDSDGGGDDADDECPGAQITKDPSKRNGVRPGQVVTLKGINFGSAAGDVRFGETSASLKKWKDTTVKFFVPDVQPGSYLVGLQLENAISTPAIIHVRSDETVREKDAMAFLEATLAGTPWWEEYYKPFRAVSKKLVVPVVRLYELYKSLSPVASNALKALFTVQTLSRFYGAGKTAVDIDAVLSETGHEYIDKMRDEPPGCAAACGAPQPICLTYVLTELAINGDGDYSTSQFREMSYNERFTLLNTSSLFRCSSWYHGSRKKLLEAGMDVISLGYGL